MLAAVLRSPIAIQSVDVFYNADHGKYFIMKGFPQAEFQQYLKKCPRLAKSVGLLKKNKKKTEDNIKQ